MAVAEDEPGVRWAQTREGRTIRWLCLVVGLCALVAIGRSPYAAWAVVSTAVAVRSLAELSWYQREWVRRGL
jgi:hypothetical protein